MVTVRKHSQRRVSAPQQGPSFPNSPRRRNIRRSDKGMRKIHIHSNVNMVDLDVSVRKAPPRAVYGWLLTRISNLTATLHRTKNFEYNEELASFQRAKHLMEYLLIEDVVDDEKSLSQGEKLRLVRKRVFPTFEYVYNLNEYDENCGKQDGYTVIMQQLDALCDKDAKYSKVRDILKK